MRTLAERVAAAREIRERLQCGIYEAKRMVDYEDLESDIEKLETMEDVKSVLRNLLRYVR